MYHTTKQKILSSCIYIFNGIKFFDLYNKFNLNSHNIILEYHRVGPLRDLWSLPPVDPNEFELQIAYLINNYNIISLDKLVGHILHGISLPKKTAVITFDDGYKDIFEYAYPILKKWNLPATIFLTTGHIGTGNLFWWDKLGYIIWNSKLRSIQLDQIGKFDLSSKKSKLKSRYIIIKYILNLNENYKNKILSELIDCIGLEIPDSVGRRTILSWEDIEVMNKENIDFGAHTITHPILRNMSLEQARYEIVESKNTIEAELDNQVTSFSYPNGMMGNNHKAISDILANNGFLSAVTTFPGRVNLNSNPFELGRIPSGWDLGSFKFFSSGFYFYLREILLLNKTRF